MLLRWVLNNFMEFGKKTFWFFFVVKLIQWRDSYIVTKKLTGRRSRFYLVSLSSQWPFVSCRDLDVFSYDWNLYQKNMDNVEKYKTVYWKTTQMVYASNRILSIQQYCTKLLQNYTRIRKPSSTIDSLTQKPQSFTRVSDS